MTINAIRKQWRHLYFLGIKEGERHEKRRAVLKARLKALQARCPHPQWIFHDDPSGGNDGYNECSVCRHEE